MVQTKLSLWYYLYSLCKKATCLVSFLYSTLFQLITIYYLYFYYYLWVPSDMPKTVAWLTRRGTLPEDLQFLFSFVWIDTCSNCYELLMELKIMRLLQELKHLEGAICFLFFFFFLSGFKFPIGRHVFLKFCDTLSWRYFVPHLTWMTSVFSHITGKGTDVLYILLTSL